MVNVDMYTDTPIANGYNLHKISLARYLAKKESIRQVMQDNRPEHHVS